MKLYSLPNKSHFKLENDEEIFFFDHIDGMYSVCYDNIGRMINFAAYTEVTPIP